MVKFKNNVLKFESEKPTNPSLWKYSEEYSVMATLMYYYPEKYWNLIHSDKPDLQYEDKIGIEVTKCLEETYNKSIGEWTSYRLGKKGKTYTRCEEIISQQGGQLFDGGIVHPASDENTQMNPIKKNIDSKFLKLKEYRQKFHECSLAIILEDPMPAIPNMAIDYFCKKQEESAYRFDSFIIVTYREIIIFDFKTQNIEKKTYSQNEKLCFDNIGVMIVNGMISDPKECLINEELL